MPEGQSYPYEKVVANLEQVLRAGSATALGKPIQKQFQKNPEQRGTATQQRRDVIMVTTL